MAADDYSTEYHLTPDGWVKGSERFFSRPHKEVERPQNAVETWEDHATQSSIYSDDYHHVKMLWHDESVPKSERDGLHAKFKRPFPEAEWSKELGPKSRMEQARMRKSRRRR